MPTSDPDDPLVSLPQLIFLHIVAIVEFGGAPGVRDRGTLEAALARPVAGFGGTRLFHTPFDRAAALMEALLRNPGFVDGNKRTSVMAAAFWLEREGFELLATSDELLEITLSVVEHRTPPADLAGWLERPSHARQPTA